MYKKITLFALIVSIVGFIVEFYSNLNLTILYILDYFTFNVSIGADFFWIKGDLLRLFFNFLLFIGALAFYFSKEKETRILRFVFSILFVEQCFFVVFRLYQLFFGYRPFNLKDFLSSSLSIAVAGFVIYFLYKSMKYLNAQKALDYETFVYTEYSEISYFKTSNWQRVLHYVIDTAVFAFIGFQFLYFLIRIDFFNSFFRTIQNQFSERFILVTLVVIFRTIFYFLFEALFEATPGKFLTESKVADLEGVKPAKSALFKRTLSRSIPFNPISFWFKADWHDSFSHTTVFKEKKTGMRGVRYFLIIPFFAVFCYGASLWKEKLERDRYYDLTFETFETQKTQILDALKLIDTSTVLQLKRSQYSSSTKFLKVDKISNSKIDFLLLKANNVYDKTLLEQAFAASRDTLKRISINRSDLEKMVITDFKEWPEYYFGEDKRDFVGISNIPQLAGKNIETVLQLYAPDLKVYSIDKLEKNFVLQLENKGTPVKIISIASDEDLKWKELNVFPMTFSEYGMLTLGLKGDINDFKLEITALTESNIKFVYEISNANAPNMTNVKLIKKS